MRKNQSGTFIAGLEVLDQKDQEEDLDYAVKKPVNMQFFRRRRQDEHRLSKILKEKSL